ncbi:N-acetylglucosamine repressor [bioreactor metagenome]|jgi:glucokinase-like ROK family protein|uniref:N-acetylglucosamine repressor n=1 Tax=bioreactor metagenome TaxID=1076179 RepID=A0A644UAG7_9ZZZZ|nr:ROK family transcriptional regulator [Lentimicrobium sp.]MEA5111541.1 ROK family transcriptional regulator [Lentimicrobium sp.]
MAGIKYLFKSSFSEEPLKNNQLRKLNLKQFIVRELYQHTNLSIHNLARTIKMSTPTITRALEELISEGMVTEIGIGESTGGRRPSIYGLNPLSRFVIGIDIERYFIRIGLFNFANQPVSEIHELNTGLETQSDIIGFITEKISELIEAYGVDENNILGIGISLPGLIDMRTGLSYTYLNTGKPVAQILSERTSLPVFIEQDTRAMAWGEQSFGLARDLKNVLCLNIGSGIGLSMILDGKIYMGHTGYSGEFGHIQIEPNGQLCHCGKIGCIETVASGKVMLAKAKKDIADGAITQISSMIGGDLSKLNIRIILNAAREGDQYAIDLLARIGEALGKGLATLIHLFNPELIIIGGEISKAADYLIAPIESNLNIYSIARIRRDAVIVASELSDNARLMGTVALVMNKIFA